MTLRAPGAYCHHPTDIFDAGSALAFWNRPGNTRERMPWIKAFGTGARYGCPASASRPGFRQGPSVGHFGKGIRQGLLTRATGKGFRIALPARATRKDCRPRLPGTPIGHGYWQGLLVRATGKGPDCPDWIHPEAIGPVERRILAYLTGFHGGS